MKKYLFTLLLIMAALPAYAEIPPEVKSIHASTLENQGVHGDSILIVYNKAMIIPASPYPLAGGMEDVNNVPGSEKKAPAEYPNNKGNATGKNAAKNYWVTITPGPYSRTKPFQGTWADLGGTAVYLKADPYRKMVLLLPPSINTNLFEPGDTVEITVVTTVTGPRGTQIHSQKNHGKNIAS